MGMITDARIRAFQEAAGIRPASPEYAFLLREFQRHAVEAIKTIELEISGIRDGDGFWHGSDVMGHVVGEMLDICERIERHHRECDKAHGAKVDAMLKAGTMCDTMQAEEQMADTKRFYVNPDSPMKDFLEDLMQQALPEAKRMTRDEAERSTAPLFSAAYQKWRQAVHIVKPLLEANRGWKWGDAVRHLHAAGAELPDNMYLKLEKVERDHALDQLDLDQPLN